MAMASSSQTVNVYHGAIFHSKLSSFPAGHQLMAGFFGNLAFINSPSMVLFPEPLAPT